MKRDLEILEAHEDIASMAKSLMLLSGGGGPTAEYYNNRAFTCKTCNRQFSSFQALGGHRASHKKPRLTAGGDQPLSSPPKRKTHECSICGLEFPIGQALGGHMRRHRAAASTTIDDDNHDKQTLPNLSLFPPIVKKANSRRVLCLDLNLTPSENKFVFGKIINATTSAVDCFL